MPDPTYSDDPRNDTIPVVTAFVESLTLNERCELASHEGVTVNQAGVLADDPDYIVRRILAKNPALYRMPDVLAYLGRDPHEEVREAVSRRRDLPGLILSILYRHVSTT